MCLQKLVGNLRTVKFTMQFDRYVLNFVTREPRAVVLYINRSAIGALLWG